MPRAAVAERSTIWSRPLAGDRYALRRRRTTRCCRSPGFVPNGVPAAFLTAPDGTAVRADVKDNGYEFLLANQRTTEQRYVVWTGGDGTPHVQPVFMLAIVRPSTCKAPVKLAASIARVSPDDLFPCARPLAIAVDVPPALPRRTSRARRPRVASALRYVAPCWAAPVAPKFVLPAGRVPVAPPVAVAPGRPVPARARRPAAGTQTALTATRNGVASIGWLLPVHSVVLTLLAVTVAAVSVTILAWIVIGTANDTQRVVDNADRATNDAVRSMRRLDRTTRDLDPPCAPCAAPPTPSRGPPPPPDPSLHCRLPGRLAQLGERRLDKAEVTGSSPVSPTSRKPRKLRGFLLLGGRSR